MQMGVDISSLETGGLFRLIARLMSQGASTLQNRYAFFRLFKNSSDKTDKVS